MYNQHLVKFNWMQFDAVVDTSEYIKKVTQ